MRVHLITLIILSIFSCQVVKTVNAEISSVKTQETTATSKTSATPSSEISSYILFWPLTAGKTEGDSLYFLKMAKEQITGWFIFGNMKKADYALYLGSKRVLEAEKLLKAGKNDLALKTLEKAMSRFSSSYKNVKKESAKKQISKDEIRRDRLIHIKTLIDFLKTTSSEETRPVLESVKDSADAILRDYLP